MLRCIQAVPGNNPQTQRQEWLSQEWEESNMTDETKRLDSGDQLISGIDNIDEARAKLKKAITLLVSVGQRKFQAWSTDAVGGGYEYFSGPGTDGWLLSTRDEDTGSWQLGYTTYECHETGVIVITDDKGYRELPVSLVKRARKNLKVLVDGLIDRFPGFGQELTPFFDAADAD